VADELDRLDALGRVEAPLPDPGFVDRLQRRLADAPPPSTFRLPVLLPAAAVLAVVVGIAVLLLTGGSDESEQPTVVVQAAAESALRQAIPVTVDLEVVRRPRRAVLTWSGPDGARQVVLRGRRVVAVYDDERTHVDRVARARFVVVVLDGDGRPVARSRAR
jgi:hypothetical protein